MYIEILQYFRKMTRSSFVFDYLDPSFEPILQYNIVFIFVLLSELTSLAGKVIWYFICNSDGVMSVICLYFWEPDHFKSDNVFETDAPKSKADSKRPNSFLYYTLNNFFMNKQSSILTFHWNSFFLWIHCIKILYFAVNMLWKMWFVRYQSNFYFADWSPNFESMSNWCYHVEEFKQKPWAHISFECYNPQWRKKLIVLFMVHWYAILHSINQSIRLWRKLTHQNNFFNLSV